MFIRTFSYNDESCNMLNLRLSNCTEKKSVTPYPNFSKSKTCNTSIKVLNTTFAQLVSHHFPVRLLKEVEMISSGA